MTLQQLAPQRGLGLDEAQSIDEHAERLATRIATALSEAIERNGRAVLALSGGRSPEPVLACLNRMELDWQKVIITLADERWVPQDHPDSNGGMVCRCLKDAMQLARWEPMYRGQSPEQDAAEFDTLLQSLLPLDVLVLGMGTDGHTASLFPGIDGLETSVSEEAPVFCRAIPGNEERLPRITMTGKALNQATIRLLQINGPQKRQALTEAFSASPAERPIAAFLEPPMDIYYSPEG
ncbi:MULTISPECIES: 6-phosphogluconolactonase [Pseudomonas]|uniref:6-phosphogluconolactonase n=1 Tax=Pseudomonas TaxID=286 RepID=UPI00123B1F33|nr:MULTISPECIES: 6-phosphogluconolactonase [Pseudomonas]QIB52736.1 6-phosphogluconolactonase [Pseudomonas sp. OIL-1]